MAKDDLDQLIDELAAEDRAITSRIAAALERREPPASRPSAAAAPG